MKSIGNVPPICEQTSQSTFGVGKMILPPQYAVGKEETKFEISRGVSKSFGQPQSEPRTEKADSVFATKPKTLEFYPLLFTFFAEIVVPGVPF